MAVASLTAPCRHSLDWMLGKMVQSGVHAIHAMSTCLGIPIAISSNLKTYIS
jgi:hypothetical protein